MSSLLPVSRGLVWMGLAAFLPAFAWGQGSLLPIGGEFSITGPKPGDQTHPGLAMGGSGGVAVWQDNAIDGAGFGIGAVRLNADFLPSGSAFRVNDTVVGEQENPRVTALPDGGAAFVWQSNRKGFRDVYARFQRADGTFATKDVPVSQPLFGVTNKVRTKLVMFRNNRARNRTVRGTVVYAQRLDFSVAPVVATLADGNLAVAYASYSRNVTNEPAMQHNVTLRRSRFVTNSAVITSTRMQDNMQDIYLQRFTPGGAKLGSLIQVNTSWVFNQRDPGLEALNNGNFVVVWVSEHRQALPPSGVSAESFMNVPEIYARLFNAAGVPLTGEILVNSGGLAGTPAVAALPNGGFRVAWTQRGSNRTDGWDIYTRAFNAAGTAAGAALRVNTDTIGEQRSPSIVSSPKGELIAWVTGVDRDRLTQLQQAARVGSLTPAETAEMQEQNRLAAAYQDIEAQWISNHVLVGAQFRVNTTSSGRQFMPVGAVNADGNFLIGWTGLGGGSGFDLFGQVLANP